jgi:tRNA(fMet)-specific endonuclease VapC
LNLRYLLDTSVFSEPCQKRPNPHVMRRLKRHEDEIAVASVVWHEMRYGAARLVPSKRRSEIEQYLEEVRRSALPVRDYGLRAAEWHAVERARLAALGRTPPFVDGQIAAIAAVNELILATTNARDFSGFKGLRVESWA